MTAPLSARLLALKIAGSANHQGAWLSVSAAAVRAGNSSRTVKRWIAAGLLPAVRLPSPKGRGPLRIRVGDLESLIASGSLG
jgi:hypothetical protein